MESVVSPFLTGCARDGLTRHLALDSRQPVGPGGSCLRVAVMETPTGRRNERPHRGDGVIIAGGP